MSDDQEFGELAHGYASQPMHEKKPDPEPLTEHDGVEDIKTVARAIEQKWRDEGRTPNGELVRDIDRSYVKPDGSRVEDDKIVNQTELAHDLSKVYRSEADRDRQQQNEALAAEIDATRLELNPQNAELKAQLEAQQQAPVTEVTPEAQQPEAQQPADPNDELVKAWRSTDPRVRQAMELQVAAIQKAQEEYASTTMGQAQFVARAVFHDFPELVSKTPEQINGIVAAYQATNPERAAQIQLRTHEAVSLAQQAEAAQQQQRQLQQQARQRELRNYTKQQDALLYEKMPELADKTRLREASDNALTTLRDIGFSDDELASAARGDGSISLHDHRVQMLLMDAVRFRQAKAGVARADKPDVPIVQRPGTHRGFSNSSDEGIQALERRLAKSGSMRDATALRLAKLRARG